VRSRRKSMTFLLNRAWSHRGVGVVGCFCFLVLTTGIMRCVGAPTFQYRTAPPDGAWLLVLLLRCVLIDGTCVVRGAGSACVSVSNDVNSQLLIFFAVPMLLALCGSCGPSGPVAVARPLKPQQRVSGRDNVGATCLRVTNGWCLTCAGPSEEHGEHFQPPVGHGCTPRCRCRWLLLLLVVLYARCMPQRVRCAHVSVRDNVT
jgi:hypothetical protein